jgi:CO/xanthine dehydrogenase Mo-binding subunit
MSSTTNTYGVNHPLLLVGNGTITRRNTAQRITGQSKFTSDIRPPDIGTSYMLYMGLVTCPYAHAQVKSIDVSAAEAAGYITLTSADLPPYSTYSLGRPYAPMGWEGHMICAGQPVVAVAAPSPDEVEDARRLISIEYEKLPYVLDAEEALQPGAPQLWGNGNQPQGNTVYAEGTVVVGAATNINVGNAQTALSQADATVTFTASTQFQQHFSLETVGVVAYWTGGILYLWGKDSYAAGTQSSLASYFGLPLTSVVVRTSLGGNESGMNIGSAVGDIAGAGGIPDADIVVAVMSKKAQAPVKFVMTRAENARWSNFRYPVKGTITLGGTNAGSLTAVQVSLYSNVGCSGGSSVVSDFADHYAYPNISVSCIPANTNAYYKSTYMRNVNASQGHFFLETAVDMLAEKLNIDPVTFRANNMRTTGNDPTTNHPLEPNAALKAFTDGAAAFGWTSKWQGWGIPSSTSGTTRNGVGAAVISYSSGGNSNPSTCQIQLAPNGTVTVFTGHTDQGGGNSTSIPIMAAEALGLTSLNNIVLVASDTALTTSTGMTNGTSGTRNAGMAAISAAQNLGNLLFPIVAKKLAPGTLATNLAFKNGTIYDTTNPSNMMTFSAAAALLTAPITGASTWTYPTNPYTNRIGGGRFVEVQVDTETADVSIINYTGSLDIGRVIFRKGAQSQCRGAFCSTGIGEGLYEELLNDPSTGLKYSGSPINNNYRDNKLPTIMEAPSGTVNDVWEEFVDPTNVNIQAAYGGKGIGEPCLAGTSAAIVNALSNALGGYRFTSLPVRKEHIVAALQWMKQQGLL